MDGEVVSYNAHILPIPSMQAPAPESKPRGLASLGFLPLQKKTQRPISFTPPSLHSAFCCPLTATAHTKCESTSVLFCTNFWGESRQVDIDIYDLIPLSHIFKTATLHQPLSSTTTQPNLTTSTLHLHRDLY
jgi:hypothetical protein